jgi:hypothetical protein
LVDCIDIKVSEEIPVRDVSSVESTTEDIVEFEYEQCPRIRKRRL